MGTSSHLATLSTFIHTPKTPWVTNATQFAWDSWSHVPGASSIQANLAGWPCPSEAWALIICNSGRGLRVSVDQLLSLTASQQGG